ncbi:MAG: hypothetical protein IPJ84_16535 [Bdellovibrionales bacterium]|nr:hypothetical protein [Bdellovibrionales bacterium]
MIKNVLSIAVLISLCSPSFARELVSEKHQVVPVAIPIFPGNLHCNDGFDDWGQRETNLWLDWNYKPYTLLQTGDGDSSMYYYARDTQCPYLPTIENEASAQNGLIFRDLSTTMQEFISTEWGGCKRFLWEQAEVQILPGIVIRGSQYRIVENLPMARCGFQ